MFKFKEIPASKKSLSQRKLILGVATNDADYQVRLRERGRQYCCPIYNIWDNMIQRCYDPFFINKQQEYKDCFVCDEWLTFSVFYKWVKKQDWTGKQNDKDILKTNNKIYAPHLCIFVDQKINKLISRKSKDKRKLPQGVSVCAKDGRFLSQCGTNSNNNNLGKFDTIDKAHAAYLKFKSNHVHEIALQQSDPKLKSALIRISGEIARGEYYK